MERSHYALLDATRLTAAWPSAHGALLTLALFVGVTACGGRRETASDPGRVDVSPEEWEALRGLLLTEGEPPADPTNRYADDPRAISFGQKLFFYRGFAGPLLESDNDGGPESLGVRGETGRVACAGCHVPKSGFVDTRSRGRQISLASGWTIRRAPSLLDVGQKKLFTWVGKSDTLYSHVFTVLENEREMNSSRLFVAQETYRQFREEYEPLFGPLPPLDDAERFPPLSPERAGCDAPAPLTPPVCRGRPGDGGPFDAMALEDQEAVTRVVVNVGKALGAYQRRLKCGRGRFDRWLAGDDGALTAAEKRGALVFVGRGRCIRCHDGPYLSDFWFHNVGLEPGAVAVAFIERNEPGARAGLERAVSDPLNSRSAYSDGDDGRLPEELDDSLLGSFATPSLRCVSRRPSFMHTGQIRSLEAVVEFFDRGGNTRGFLGRKEIEPLGLSARERADLVAFLRALDGEGPAAELLVDPY